MFARFAFNGCAPFSLFIALTVTIAFMLLVVLMEFMLSIAVFRFCRRGCSVARRFAKPGESSSLFNVDAMARQHDHAIMQ